MTKRWDLVVYDKDQEKVVVLSEHPQGGGLPPPMFNNHRLIAQVDYEKRQTIPG